MKKLRIVAGIVLAFAVASICIGAGIYYWKENVQHWESGALSELSALYTMQANYNRDHGRYAESFQQLGVPLGAALSGQDLDWRGGYRYSLVPVRRDWSDEVTGYLITARPQKYGHGSKKSLSIDNFGTVHYTNEDRAPDQHDPVTAVAR